MPLQRDNNSTLDVRPSGDSGPNSGSSNPLPLPSLPKGGGAIRALGEKFSANPATGAASITVPLFTSPGRNGFHPQLKLAYDSGSGNGPFGVGWGLSVPAISRRTDKGLPRYFDENDSEITGSPSLGELFDLPVDTFILSCAEDLVPLLDANGQHPIDFREGLPHRPPALSSAERPPHGWRLSNSWKVSDADIPERSRHFGANTFCRPHDADHDAGDDDAD